MLRTYTNYWACVVWLAPGWAWPSLGPGSAGNDWGWVRGKRRRKSAWDKRKKIRRANRSARFAGRYFSYLTAFFAFSPTLRSLVPSQAWPFKWNLFFSLVVVLHAIFVWYVFLAIESMGKILWSDYSHGVYCFQHFWNFLNFFTRRKALGPMYPAAHVITSFVTCAVVQSAPGLYFVADFKIAIYNLVNI